MHPNSKVKITESKICNAIANRSLRYKYHASAKTACGRDVTNAIFALGPIEQGVSIEEGCCGTVRCSREFQKTDEATNPSCRGFIGKLVVVGAKALASVAKPSVRLSQTGKHLDRPVGGSECT